MKRWKASFRDSPILLDQWRDFNRYDNAILWATSPAGTRIIWLFLAFFAGYIVGSITTTTLPQGAN